MLIGGLAIIALAAGGWWYFGGGLPEIPAAADGSTNSETALADGQAAPPVVDLPDDTEFTGGPAERAAEPAVADAEDEPLFPRGADLASLAAVTPPDPEPAPQQVKAEPQQRAFEPKAESTNTAIAVAQKKLADGKTLEARRELNALLKENRLSSADAAEVRNILSRIADQSIFSSKRIEGDPLTDTYKIQSGDVLINIGKDYKVPHEILMRINNIAAANRIRADERIKVLRGPFHARIDKSEFRLDIYLQDTYVKSFRVGLGADQGTPEGTWSVKERLPNPTYYPPPSATDKRIIPPNDPRNPLGDHWIGLEGVSGDAVGRYGYGIHGTIEPDSIGKAVSMGCVRMRNEDVAFLYTLLMPGESQVTIVP